MPDFEDSDVQKRIDEKAHHYEPGQRSSASEDKKNGEEALDPSLDSQKKASTNLRGRWKPSSKKKGAEKKGPPPAQQTARTTEPAAENSDKPQPRERNERSHRGRNSESSPKPRRSAPKSSTKSDRTHKETSTRTTSSRRSTGKSSGSSSTSKSTSRRKTRYPSPSKKAKSPLSKLVGAVIDFFNPKEEKTTQSRQNPSKTTVKSSNRRPQRKRSGGGTGSRSRPRPSNTSGTSRKQPGRDAKNS